MNPIIFNILYFIIYLYSKTWRVKWHWADPTLEAQNSIFAGWHDQIIPLAMGWKRNKKATLASNSKDGEIIAKFLLRRGFTVARGSSSKGGLKAILSLKKIINEGGYDVALTVDGPRGPRHVVKSGTIFLAKLTNYNIVSVCYECKRYIKFKSWDKMRLPLPFSTLNAYVSPLFKVSDDMSAEGIEADRLKLETFMKEQTSVYSPSSL